MDSILTFEHLVKKNFALLSAAQKKVAEYLLQHLEKAAFSTAVQIGREADVSETTVIRLSYALGFRGFSEMQEFIQKQILDSASSSYKANHAKNAIAADDTNPFAKVIENEIQILSQMFRELDTKEIWQAVDALIRADQVFVVGYRASYAVAYWFSLMLGMMRTNVDICPSNGDDHQKLCNLTDQSVVLAISFPRYIKRTLQLSEYAKKQGATLISVTDRLLSPIGRISDITLTTDRNVDPDTGLVSMSSVMSLLYLVINGINMKDQERIQARQQKLEQLYANYDLLLE